MSRTVNEELAKMKCVPCSGKTPAVGDAEIAVLRLQLPKWSVIKEEGVKKLLRIFRFDDFARALAFTDQVGEVAEAEQHHPAILTEYGKVTVTWWTHAIKGLSQNDFIMAAKTDKLQI